MLNQIFLNIFHILLQIKVLTSFLVITTHICAISAQDMLNKTSKISSGFKRTSELYTLHRKHLIFAVNNICMKGAFSNFWFIFLSLFKFVAYPQAVVEFFYRLFN